ncbi:MAG: hypothetical protein M0008_11635 [Actinomycetota bacterium]|nr:hypothetical protein [Actinomycetota bacterium]
MSSSDAAGATLFFGTHDQVLDEKFRAVLPRDFYEVFKEIDGFGGVVMLSPHFGDSIAVWDTARWEDRLARYHQDSGTPEGYKVFRAFARASHSVKLDGQHRFVVPQLFRDRLGLVPGSSISWQGIGDHLEITALDRWPSDVQEDIDALVAVPGPPGSLHPLTSTPAGSVHDTGGDQE